MKFQISDKIIFSADKYAKLSCEHTYNYKGFENDKIENKKKRIKIGKIAEYWTAEYCYKNGIEYKLDMTDYTQSDDEDILINNIKIDCKSSVSLKYAGQVQPSHDLQNKKDSRNEYYSFYVVDLYENCITPLGFMEKEWLIESSDKVLKGQKIRNGIIQRHDPYSYFIKDFKSLINFNDHISWLKGHT